MTKKEAKKVLLIMVTADNGCPVCGSLLFQDFVEAFPQHEAVADEVWQLEYGSWANFRNEQ